MPKTPQVYIPSRTGIVSVYVSVFHNVSSVGLQESISSDFIIDPLNLQVNRYNVCYIQNAESTLADMLRLEGQHELPDGVIQGIRDLETNFDTLKSD